MRRSFPSKSPRTTLTAILGGLVFAATALAGTAQAQSLSVTDPARLQQRIEIGIGDVTVREPLSDPEQPVVGPSQVPARFTVKMSRQHGGPVTISYRTVDGTAKAGFDYTARSGAVTIPEGATSATIDVMVRADRAVEPNETFGVELTGVTNVVGIPIADAKGVATILDNTF